jgi:hypothetical protein
MARAKVSLAPIVLAGLVGAALVVGGMLGAAATSALDVAGTTGRSAQANTTSASLETQALIQFRAGERDSAARDAETTSGVVSQALINVRASEREPAAQAVAPHAQDHIGISERLFPIEVGQSERLSPIVMRHAPGHGPLAN